jgi:hypothetical protein
MNINRHRFFALQLIAFIVLAAASCTHDDSRPVDAVSDENQSAATRTSNDDDGLNGRAQNSTIESGSEQSDPSDESSDRQGPPLTTVTFNDTEYIFRSSEGGLYRFTPEGQEDLSKWSDMLSINIYPGSQGEHALRDIFHSVFATYVLDGDVEAGESQPNTKTGRIEHLVVVTFVMPDFDESLRARFLLVGESCVGITHSHRTYGESANTDLQAWLDGGGADVTEKLMEWDDYPTPAELEALNP